jgi:formylmethanofuran dehydrogenase subunit D
MLKPIWEELSRVLAMAENRRLHMVLLTGRTIEQGVGREFGKSSKEYTESVSICFVDSEDLHALGIKEDSNVSVSTAFGSVILRAIKSPRGPHKGVIFVPYGPWANVIVDPSTDSIGMPSLKGIPAEIEPTQKRVLKLKQLLTEEFGDA